MADKDYLWLHLRDLPYFRAMLRAVEARFYQDFEFSPPTLDVGCGDGHFSSIAFDRPLDVGLDPWAGPIRQAARLGGYRFLVQADGGQMPFPDGYFASAVSNSVLEHIPNVDLVLAETGRVLRPGASFLFCVPNHNFNPNLSFGRALDRMGMFSLGRYYRKLFDQIARHFNLDQPEIWQDRLYRAGFRIERWWHYFSPDALRILEWGHLFGLPSLLCERLFGHWILVPKPWNLYFTRRLVQRYYNQDPVQPNGVCTFYIARRI